jgi:hypothetical protein
MIAQETNTENSISLGILQNKSNPNAMGGAELEAVRLYRWALQDHISGILGEGWRTNYCMRRMHGGEVKLLYDDKHSRSHYKGLMTCSSIWNCPLCNAKIMTRRAKEIKKIPETKYQMTMVTFTIQHQLSDPLGQLVGDLNDGIKYLRRSKKFWDKTKRDYGIIGTITGLEVRYSTRTGWHPHKHCIYLHNNDVTVNPDALKSRLEKRYCKRLENLGYRTTKETVDVRKAHLDWYISKWGFENELTAGMMKKSKKSISVSPFELAMKDENKFREYANGMFRKRALVWSPGLKKMMGIEEKTDEEINLEETEESREVINLTKKHWKVILKKKLRGKLLSEATKNQGDWKALALWLHSHGVFDE